MSGYYRRGDFLKIDRIKKRILKQCGINVICKEFRKSIVLEGEAETWDKALRAGKIAAKYKYKGVVNKIKVKGVNPKGIRLPDIVNAELEGKEVDVLIIGAGIIGCSIARELSKWDLSVLVIDKEEDVAMHASSRNDGMVHPPLATLPGTKKAKYCSLGNKLYDKISKELDIDFKRVGQLTLCKTKPQYTAFKLFSKYVAHKNNMGKIEFWNKEKIKEREPNVKMDVAGGVFIPSAGIVCPYNVTIAFMENAIENGVELSLNTAALAMTKKADRIMKVKTNKGSIKSKVIVNAAGVFSDKIAAMADDEFFSIHPRKGTDAILDSKKGNVVNSVVGIVDLKSSKKQSKGGGIIKTIDGNILIGPNAVEIMDLEDYSTDSASMEEICKKQFSIVNGLGKEDIITYFSGIRAATYEEDFIVEASETVGNLVHAAGIQSPGVASAPAIALDIEKIVVEKLKSIQSVKENSKYNPYRKGIVNVKKLGDMERDKLIKSNPDYGVIICRCEEISKGEIVDALNSPIKPRSVDAIKRRVRAGMGRCQGGFCMPLVTEIIAEQSHMDMCEITKKGDHSFILVNSTKGDEENDSL